MNSPTTPDDIAYTAAIRDRDAEAARHRNDATRYAAGDDPGQLARIEAALCGELSVEHRRMLERVRDRLRAGAGLVPVLMAAAE